MRFRTMRRKNQSLSVRECDRILEKGTAGVLAVQGEDGYPYTIPLNYVYQESKLFFHCAPEGHKTDAISKESKVSFCVIDQDEIIPEEYTTYYRSVIVFGKARIIKDFSEKAEALHRIGKKYSSAFAEGYSAEIKQALSKTCIIEVTIEHLTGKEAIELTKKRQRN